MNAIVRELIERTQTFLDHAEATPSDFVELMQIRERLMQSLSLCKPTADAVKDVASELDQLMRLNAALQRWGTTAQQALARRLTHVRRSSVTPDRSGRFVIESA